MIALLLALTLQGGSWTVRPDRPTVGDTVRLVRTLSAPAGVRARLQPLERSETVEALELPTSGYDEGGVTVQYTVALFAPGRRAVVMPEIELLYPDGRVESVPADSVWVTVTSCGWHRQTNSNTTSRELLTQDPISSLFFPKICPMNPKK